MFSNALFDRYKRYRLAVMITLSVAATQFVVARIFAPSIALLGDAFHGAADMFVLLGVTLLTRHELNGRKRNLRAADRTFTHVAIFLLIASALYVGYEGYERIVRPTAFHEWYVMLTAGLAAVGSIIVHRIISKTDVAARDHKHAVSIAHVLADIAISVIVFLSALAVKLFGAPALDGYGAILIALWMVGYSFLLWRGAGDQHHHHHPH